MWSQATKMNPSGGPPESGPAVMLWAPRRLAVPVKQNLCCFLHCHAVFKNVLDICPSGSSSEVTDNVNIVHTSDRIASPFVLYYNVTEVKRDGAPVRRSAVRASAGPPPVSRFGG